MCQDPFSPVLSSTVKKSLIKHSRGQSYEVQKSYLNGDRPTNNSVITHRSHHKQQQPRVG